MIDAHETLAFLSALQPRESLCSQTAPARVPVSPPWPDSLLVSQREELAGSPATPGHCS